MTWFKFKSTKNEELIKDLTTEVSLLRNELTVHKDGHAYSSSMLDGYLEKAMSKIEEVDSRIAKWEKASLTSKPGLNIRQQGHKRRPMLKPILKKQAKESGNASQFC